MPAMVSNHEEGCSLLKSGADVTPGEAKMPFDRVTHALAKSH
jgi:hypothetical protein